ELSLVNGQSSVIQLENGQVHWGDESGADMTAGPTAVAGLRTNDVLEVRLFVTAPGETILRLRLGEQLDITNLAKHVHRLRVVIVRVLVVAKTRAAKSAAQVLLAEGEPLLDQRRIVIAKTKTTSDGCRRQGRPALTTAAAAERVDDASLAIRGIVQILLGHLDGFLRHDDAGVARGAQRLNLRDRHRAFIEVATLFGRD